MKEGFCWIDVNSTYLKARLKANGVFDVLSMSLFTMTQIPDWYYVSMINSSFVSEYVDVFINNTSHFQINDARQLPIIIPSRNDLAIIKGLFEEALVVKSEEISSTDTKSKIEEKLSNIQKRIDNFVERLYLI